ncbi:DUF2975 domain-containing protein [Spirosoma areae]
MEKHSATWVFPTVKVLANLLYYFVLISLIVFTVKSSLTVFDLPAERFIADEEPAGYVSVPVAWGAVSDKPMVSTGEPRVVLKPQKQTGQLQVPIRSTPGLLIVALGFVGLATAVWTFSLLRQIFQKVQTESPFHINTARRIHQMGLLFVGQTLLEIVLKMALWSQTRPYFRQIHVAYSNFLSVDLQLNGPWLLGLILLALAQVYRRGIELQAESELTI